MASQPQAPRQDQFVPPPPEMAPAPAQPQLPSPVAVPQQQPQQPEQAQEPLWAGFDWLPLEDNDKEQLFNILMASMQQGLTPDQTAQLLREKYTAEVCAVVPAIAPPDKVLEGIRTARATRETILAKRKGAQYLKAVWAALAPKEEGKLEAS
jgi:hypothetical protein